MLQYEEAREQLNKHDERIKEFEDKMLRRLSRDLESRGMDVSAVNHICKSLLLALSYGRL